MATMVKTSPRTRWALSLPRQSEAATQRESAVGDQLRERLSKTGRILLTEHFVRQLRKKLYDQQDVLGLVDHSQAWVLQTLYKELHAVRAAATLLKQHNMAAVAARGEVLVQLINHGIVTYEARHRDLLEDTLQLLNGILDRIECEGSDTGCFSTTRTALCLYAAAEPQTQYYEPGHLPQS
jgi:hypothetical protein